MRYVCLISTTLLSLLIAGVMAGLLSLLPFARLPAILLSGEVVFALKLTLFSSFSAVFIGSLLGLPSGYFLARCDFKGKAVVETLIDLPMAMPPLVAGVGLLLLLGNEMVQKVLAVLGVELLFSPAGAILAQVFITAPIMTRTCRSAFTAVDFRYEQAAQTLGLSPSQVFLRVALPLARPTILSGIVLCWARAVGEFGATLMVAGATRFKTETLPIAVYLNISSGELGIALVCAWLLIMTGVVVLFFLRWFGVSLESASGVAGGVQ